MTRRRSSRQVKLWHVMASSTDKPKNAAHKNPDLTLVPGIHLLAGSQGEMIQSHDRKVLFVE